MRLVLVAVIAAVFGCAPAPTASPRVKVHFWNGKEWSMRQVRAPCPARGVEIESWCWVRLAESTIPCGYWTVELNGACWVPYPERPKGPPIAVE